MQTRKFKMGQRLHKKNCTGFSLIEVMVALVIASFIISSSVITVGNIADQRIGMQERFASESIAWNKLMEQYQLVEGLISDNIDAAESNGTSEALGRQWHWELEAESTFGEDFFRYQVEVFSAGSTEGDGDSIASQGNDDNNSALLAAYFIVE